MCKVHVNAVLSEVNVALTDDTGMKSLLECTRSSFLKYGKQALKRGLNSYTAKTQRDLLCCQLQQVLPEIENFARAKQVVEALTEELKGITEKTENQLHEVVNSSTSLTSSSCVSATF